MSDVVKISIIISYYKNLTNLELILTGLNRQSERGFETIISEDDCNIKTNEFLEKNRNSYSFPILHVNQKVDNGFRKTQMLNKSIKISNGDTLVFIDGDCIPNKHFVKAYRNNIEKGYMLKGRRVMLDSLTSKKLKETKNLEPLNLISILKSESYLKKEAIYTAPFSLVLTMKNKGLLGCNWGIAKSHLLDINGFDEDYTRPAVGEDTDIEWRLKKLGVKSKSVKNKAIVYHVHHESGYSMDDLLYNRELLKKKLEENNFVCLNGLKKLE